MLTGPEEGQDGLPQGQLDLCVGSLFYTELNTGIYYIAMKSLSS